MMHGLLWFDNDPKTSLTQKIQAALVAYKQKSESRNQRGDYGLPTAELCLINPKNAEGLDLENVSKDCGLVVRAFRGVMSNHFWIGAEVGMTK